MKMVNKIMNTNNYFIKYRFDSTKTLRSSSNEFEKVSIL